MIFNNINNWHDKCSILFAQKNYSYYCHKQEVKMKKISIAIAQRLQNKYFTKLLMAALLFVAGASQATIIIYTDQASFLAAVSNPGVDGFNGFSIVGATPGPITRIAGDFGYTAAAGTDGSFFGAGSTANPWLSVNSASDMISFFNFTGGVAGLGGNFFGSNLSGLFQAGSLQLTATDANGTVSYTLTGATLASFVGFVSSTGSLISATLISIQPSSGFLWPTVDNLTLAAAMPVAVPVPEPKTFALILTSLALMGYMIRRRRHN